MEAKVLLLASTSATTTYHRTTVGCEPRPPTLVVWGRNDPSFIGAGAEAFKYDLPDSEIHLLDPGHFALDEKNDDIASLVLAFLAKHSV